MSNAVTQGSIRGLLAAAFMGILGFVQVEFDLVSEEGAAALAPVATFVAFVAGGLYDRYVRR